MRIGLTYNLKPEGDHHGDKFEEFDSPETMEALCRVFSEMGHECIRLGFGKEVVAKILEEKIDFVFNIAEGFNGRSREAHIPAFLEMMGVPYFGPDPLAAAISLDKVLAKRLASSVGVKTPPFHLIPANNNFNYSSMRYPSIMKPSLEGSSKGIRTNSKVYNPSEAKEWVEWLKTYGSPILAEEFIGGREVTVGVLGNDDPEVLGIMEIAPHNGDIENFIYSLEVKRDYEKRVNYACPANISETLEKKIKDAAVLLFKTYGCRDISRFDFRIDENDEPYFLEVNSLPGLHPVSGDIVIMARLKGIGYRELAERIITQAFRRYNLT